MTDGRSTKRRYLAAWLPFLGPERVRKTTNAPPDAPLVLIEHVANAVRIAAASPPALALGLTPGLALADARARVPDIVVHDADRDADALLLERLADLCDRYTPMVAIDSDALLLDTTGCVADDAAIAADFAARLARAGLTVRFGCGDTPDMARARALYGSDDVAAFPVAALRIDDEAVIALKRAGLKTIGDLATRPRAPLAARFGAGLVTRLARTLGEEDARITPRRVVPPIRVERRFAEPVARTQDMLATLRDLADEAVILLDARGRGGRRFAAALFRSDGDIRRLIVETGAATRDPVRIARLFDERIDGLRDPIDPGFGFDLIRFDVIVDEPLAATSPRLDGEVRGEAVDALVDRLSTRLGRSRVVRFARNDTHIPEQVTLRLPAVGTRAPVRWPAPEPGEPPLRPLHLFDPPQPVDVVAEVPDGPPVRFRWRRTLHHVARAEGPERIASEWWQRRDAAGLTRDYYRVECVRGRRYWLFRHGLYGIEKPNPGWFVHGLFA